MSIMATRIGDALHTHPTSDVLVLGGGFAGVWAAATAAHVRRREGADLAIALVAPGDDLVIRPRLYEADPDRMRVPIDRVLEPIGVRRIAATVTGIDTANRTVATIGREGQPGTIAYRRLVLATGSRLRRPDLPGAEHLYDVDTLGAATALDSHLRQLREGPGRFTAVVVGAGFAGIEVATELAGRLRERAAEHGAADEARVVLVERNDVVGPELGPGPRPAILDALAQVGVDVRLSRTLASVSPEGVRLADGAEIAARTVVWTAGLQASPLTRQVPGRHDPLGRLHVDEYLRVPESPDVFAAGDTAAAVAEPDRLVMQSCQHATPLGKHAGYNAAADLLELPGVRFAPQPYVTCLDLGAAGAVFTRGWERAVQYRGAEGKQMKQTINRRLIYPPLDDAEAILARAGDLARQVDYGAR